MASILQAKNISKSYGTKVLFDNLDFNINEGDKIALIAPNGSGKSSLLKVLSGKDSSDNGGIVNIMKDVKVAYLEQEPGFDPDRTVFEEVFAASDILSSTVAEYESAIVSGDEKRIEAAIHQMDAQDAWQYELKVKQILTQLDIHSLDQSMGELSGGQKKRVAIAGIMIHEADFIILDEPTNHLDLIVIEFLEEYLKRTQATILMVTHDRYFLDRVCNHIIELENGKLYTYKGNYSYYLEKREERIENFNSETERARNLFRGELDWMRRMPQARATKAKYRINAFYDLKERAGQVIKDKNIKIDVGSSRLGTKIINCKGVTHFYDDFCTIDDFTYNFAKGEKIGLVGPNGVGKSTFLEVMTGSVLPVSGEIDRGETLVFGFYRQTGLQYEPEDTVIDVVRKIAEVVTLADGNTMPVTQFLSRFLFPHPTHNTKVDRLSGGERRRLYLVTVLMKNPNFLILDEPTNDLDIMSLNVLEEYLLNFQGCLLIVSHDRYFLDKLADHIFVFEGKGLIKDYVGKYTEYREQVKEAEREAELSAKEAKVLAREKSAESADSAVSEDKFQKKKLSFKEQKELEKLENDIESLEKEKSSLEAALSSGMLSSEELTKSSVRIAEVIAHIDSKSDRWLELNS
ncbi:MAG: ABC-F family ATP-binding cassette domain-containing protein [Bacteroidales bacterium]|nr:ABC-F family ATP-binding cassette domain-containing protein [Bacteroidales bacterium]HNW48408.1 ABC-F family ATP-binding cassette domain-containing protein [Bacteroidales bacterium]HPS95067.1 ABC-F family ATP-binding cassette domain-containing protein [Bacteroidales bacterium]